MAGYRMIEPYVYEFRTFAKERWFGRELLEIFTKEFGANSPEYYVSMGCFRVAVIWEMALTGCACVSNSRLHPDGSLSTTRSCHQPRSSRTATSLFTRYVGKNMVLRTNGLS